jgi:hypothetical protein
MQWRLGERDEDHLSAVVFNILGIIYNEEVEKAKTLDDLAKVAEACYRDKLKP